MRRLDFISQSPQLSIFKEDANKTNLGGVLYLIYIIVLLLLAIIYFFDYFSNEKYEYNYTFVKRTLDNELEDEDMKSALHYDLDCWFVLGKDGANMEKNNIIGNENFVIVDIPLLAKKLETGERDQDHYLVINTNSDDEECIIRQGQSYNKSTGDFSLGVLYRCDGENCYIREEDKIKVTSYYLYFAYKGLKLDHQNPDKPIQPLPENSYWLETVQFLENTNIVYFFWGLIKYEEEKGIFSKNYDNVVGNSNTYYAGNMKSKETYSDDGHMKTMPDNYWRIKDENGNHFILLLYLEVFPQPNEYERYSRKKISVLDILADVSALASTVLDLMALAYGFLYSQNYDNYRIVENILTKKMNITLNPMHQNLNVKPKTFNQKIEEVNDKKSNIELSSNLIVGKKKKRKISKLLKTQTQKSIKKEDPENVNLPSPRFIDFLLHNLYFECFGHSSRQALIGSCNDIVAKYITIESILYNQMRLEYLWNDYKWNNPKYEENLKDDLILDLREK